LPAAALLSGAVSAASPVFDHSYSAYGGLLATVVKDARVDYRLLVSRKRDLDAAVHALALPSREDERRWPRDERLAFWINAYNLFTLKAIVDRYPIRAGWFTLQPRNSIRQIDGVWTHLRFRAASRDVTLDEIEHGILRPEFEEPRIHFAINCASVSCPPLAAEPFVATQLDAQLDAAARRYLASPQGVRLDGRTLRVSRIFDWYGGDFVEKFGTVRGVLAAFGPPAVQHAAKHIHVVVEYLDYDWSLNDTANTR
jgi:hypothetical protein